MLELNELSPPLLEKFMAAGDLPNFTKLYNSSVVRTTHASEEPPFLEPWIQWPTIHFGVGRDEHRAFHLGDGRRFEGAGLARTLSDSGVRVGVFGSMNLNYDRLNGYYVPDAWDAQGQAYPKELRTFASFVARQVRESSRDGAKIGLSDAFAFVSFLLRNGLRFGTLCSIGKQLIFERFRANTRWKRALLQDSISYDVFESINSKYRVEFATFFSNSVAHFQHYHWRDMAPEVFDHPLEDGTDFSHRDAIRQGYISNDRVVGRVLRSYPKATIIFATGLSQQPWTDTAKCVYRPRDFEKLLNFARISGAHAEPVMAEDFRVVGGDPIAIKEALLSLRSDGEAIMRAAVIEGGVQSGCAVFDGDARHLDRIVTGPAGSMRFGELFYRLSAMRSGRHHPEGALWIRDGSPHRVETDFIALESIAPMILNMFSVAIKRPFPDTAERSIPVA